MARRPSSTPADPFALPDLPDPGGALDNSRDGTPIPGLECKACGAPAVRKKTITTEDGRSGSMPGNGYFAIPTCDCAWMDVR